MKTYNVKKAKLIDRIFLEVELEEIIKTEDGEEVNTCTNDVAKKCRQEVHADLIAAFDALTPHLPLMCELADTMIFKPTDELLQPIITSYSVTGFSIGGNDEHEGVTLIGRKTLGTKKVLNLVAPFTKWEEEHIENYRYAHELKAAIFHACDEVLEYVVNGKVAPAKQLELPLAS